MKRHHASRISRISRLCAALLLLLLLVPPVVSVFSAAAAPAVLSQEETVINEMCIRDSFKATLAAEVKDFSPADYYTDKSEMRRTDLFAQYAMGAAVQAITDSLSLIHIWV